MGFNYTRYADDMTFSGESYPDHVKKAAKRVMEDEGFLLAEHKTRTTRLGQSQQVTGLVVNEKVNIRRAYYRRIRATIYNCQRYGLQSQNRENHPDFKAHLYGHAHFVSSVNPGPGQRLLEQLEHVDWNSQSVREPRWRVIVEGNFWAWRADQRPLCLQQSHLRSRTLAPPKHDPAMHWLRSPSRRTATPAVAPPRKYAVVLQYVEDSNHTRPAAQSAWSGRLLQPSPSGSAALPALGVQPRMRLPQPASRLLPRGLPRHIARSMGGMVPLLSSSASARRFSTSSSSVSPSAQ
jgi:hypothetical protein